MPSALRLVHLRGEVEELPPELLPDLAFADDIALMEDTINKAEAFLHKVEIATQTIGLFLNAGKTKVMHLNPTADNNIRSLNGDEIEKVDDFLYLGGYTNTTRDIKSRITKAWGAQNSLTRVWCSRIKTSTKIRIFKSTVEPIFLYGCESWSMTKSLVKKVDGTYTRMLRRVKTSPGERTCPTNNYMVLSPSYLPPSREDGSHSLDTSLVTKNLLVH